MRTTASEQSCQYTLIPQSSSQMKNSHLQNTVKVTQLSSTSKQDSDSFSVLFFHSNVEQSLVTLLRVLLLCVHYDTFLSQEI